MWGRPVEGPILAAIRLPLLIAAFAVAVLALPAIAQAASGPFVIQFSPTSLPEGSSFSLQGDSVTAFSALLRPTSCAAPADWQNDSDDIFNLQLTSGTVLALSGGQFSYQGAATSDSYGPGPSDGPSAASSRSRGRSTPAIRWPPAP